MTVPFEIDFQWLPRENGCPVERATLAELSIVVDSVHNATRLEDLFAKTTRNTARLSAFHLAQWFAANWWRLRWEPEESTFSWRMSHKVGASGNGYLWPDLSFCSEGSSVRVNSRATVSLGKQPIHYLNDFEIYIRASDFERGVDDFVEAVLARLASQNLYVDLVALWKELREERGQPDLAAWRKLEAMLGFDPDEAPEKLMENLMAETARWGTGAIEEIAASSKTEALSDLKRLTEASSKSASIQVPNITDLRERIVQEVDHSECHPWVRGEGAAHVARKVWSIGRGPVSNAMLAELFGISEERVQKPEDDVGAPMPAGFRSGNGDDRLGVFLDKRHPAGRRFALARLVGDHLMARKEDQILPATAAKTERQKFQRSFSQEFLCPYLDLIDFLGEARNNPTDDIIEDAADHFQVSSLLVKTTLVNKGVIGREALYA